MKAALDTSVLVSALHRAHPRHEDARAWLEAAMHRGAVAFVTTHARAETWSVLSRIPGPNRLSPARVRDMVRRIEDIVTVVPLDTSDYRGAIDRCADRGFSSGVVFDALHLVAAERVGAELLLTFNLDDFVRLRDRVTPRIVSPSELAPTA